MNKGVLKKLALISFLFFALPLLPKIEAQNNFFTKTIEANRAGQRSFWFGAGYSKTTFLNNVFYDNIDRDNNQTSIRVQFEY